MNYRVASLIAVCLTVLLLSGYSYADPVILQVYIDNPDVPPVDPPTPGGGSSGGGSSGGGGNEGSLVTFIGRAFPQAAISLLKDGQKIETGTADAAGEFELEADSLSAGRYYFSLYAEDSTGQRSNPKNVTLTVNRNTDVFMMGLYLSPTIKTDKSAVRQGDPIVVSGRSAPNSEITTVFHSAQEITRTVRASALGFYTLAFNTGVLEMGPHTVKSKAALESELSDESSVVNFTVGLENVLAPVNATQGLVGDLNGDGRVNIIDFSIMAFWYKRASPPVSIDLNKDGIIDIRDFSILAYHWTG